MLDFVPRPQCAPAYELFSPQAMFRKRLADPLLPLLTALCD